MGPLSLEGDTPPSLNHRASLKEAPALATTLLPNIDTNTLVVVVRKGLTRVCDHCNNYFVVLNESLLYMLCLHLIRLNDVYL